MIMTIDEGFPHRISRSTAGPGIAWPGRAVHRRVQQGRTALVVLDAVAKSRGAVGVGQKAGLHCLAPASAECFEAPIAWLRDIFMAAWCGKSCRPKDMTRG